MGFRTLLALAFCFIVACPVQAQPAAGVGAGKTPVVVAADVQEAERAYRRGEYAEALQQIERFLQKEPKDARARFLRGLILVEQRQSDAAIAAFSELALEQPELPEPHNNLAVLYAARGDYDKARDALRSALLANPNDPIANENLGDIYVRLAQRSYERAIASGGAGRALRDKLTLARDLTRGVKPAAPPAASVPSPSTTTGAPQ